MSKKQRTKSNEEKVTSSKQKLTSKEQLAKSFEQRATSKKFSLVSPLHRRYNIESRKFCRELNASKMPGRNQQRNRELKRAAQPCSKLTDLFKKSRPDDQYSTNESLDDVTGKKYARRFR